MESGTTVVVGAAHGIGAAIAHRVARELWTTRLVLAGISNAEMDSLASTLRSDRLQNSKYFFLFTSKIDWVFTYRNLQPFVYLPPPGEE